MKRITNLKNLIKRMEKLNKKYETDIEHNLNKIAEINYLIQKEQVK
jgi:hypothetical protein